MSWLFGYSKKKIEQVSPSRMGTGSPGDLSWIDEARKRIAEAERIRKAQEAEAERISKAREAEKAARAEAMRTGALYRFAAETKRLLPRGVEIVEVFFRNEPEALHDKPAVRVDLGNSVQFDLVFDYYYHYIPSGGDCGSHGSTKEGVYLRAYEVGGPFLSVISQAVQGSLSVKAFSKRRVEDLLFEALEKHDPVHSQILSH